jgi:hypothetical protein
MSEIKLGLKCTWTCWWWSSKCRNEVGTNAWVKLKQRCNNEKHKNCMETKLDHRRKSNFGEDAKVKQEWSWSKHRNDSNSEVSTNIGTKLKRKTINNNENGKNKKEI